MNGFYGIFNARGTTTEHDTFAEIGVELNARGFNTGKACEEYAFLGNHYSKADAREESASFSPCQSDDGQLVLAGYFRLDYRDELGDKLGLTHIELLQSTDASLVLKAYEKWESDCVLHLEGDWAFVLFDRYRQTVLMAKDSSGCSALFYRFEGDHLFFSSDSSVLMLATTFSAMVDPVQLLRIAVPFVRMDSGKTLVRNLYYLCNAHTMVFDGSAWSSPKPYFSFDSHPTDSYRFEEDVAFAHFSMLQQSVLQRIRSSHKVGIMLSSGMDSMAVASLSSLELSNVDLRLNTYTSFPHHLEALGEEEKGYSDETGVVRLFAERRQNVDSFFGDFGSFRLSQCDAGTHIHGPFQPILHLNDFWINGLMNKAKGDGIGLMLTGQMGNFTISGDGYFVHADLFRSLAMKSLYHELHAVSKRAGKSMWTAFRNRVMSVLWYQLKSYYHYRKLFTGRYWKQFPYLNPSFVAEFSIHIHKSKHEHIGGYYWVRSGSSLRRDLIDRHLCYAGMLWYGYGMAHGIKVSDPTSDHRLIGHSFGIGNGWFYRSGISKWIYRTMMKGVVDQEVIGNRMGKIQSHDFGLRMAGDVRLKEKLESLGQFHDVDGFFNLEAIKTMHLNIVNHPTPQLKKTSIFQFLQAFSVIHYVFSQKELILNSKSQSNVNRK